MSKQTELAQVADTITVDSGNVGIGTSDPSDVSGGANLLIVKRTDTANNYPMVHSASAGNAGWRMKNNDGDWVIIANDALRFYDIENSLERMRIDSAGRVTMPYQPFLFMRVNSDYTTGVTDPIEYDTTTQSRNLTWDTTNHRFTVPVTGVYQFSISTRLDTNTLDYMYHRILVNGANFPDNNALILQKPNTADGFQSINTSISVKLTQNDTAQVSIHYNGGGSYSLTSQSWMSVALIG